MNGPDAWNPRMILRRESPRSFERLPVVLIVHSDRGGQYVDAEFRRLPDQHRFEQSMSRADETYDNAHAESLFSRYKAELLEGGAFADVEEARMETFIYIKSYYNRARRRSALGYQSPEDFERAYYQRTEVREHFGQRPGKDTIAKQHSCPQK
jgi:transposase InsO family protein